MDIIPEEIQHEIILSANRSYLFEISQVCRSWQRAAMKRILSITNDTELKQACKIGDILSIIHSPYNRLWLRYGLVGAAELLRITTGTAIISTTTAVTTAIGPSLAYALQAACFGGHRKLVNLLMARGIDYWYYGFLGAYNANNNVLMRLMLLRGGYEHKEVLELLCESRNINLINLAIDYGATAWGRGFRSACTNGYATIVELLIIRIKNSNDLRKGLINACQFDHLPIVERIVLFFYYADHDLNNREIEAILDESLNCAILNGNRTIVNFLRRSGSRDTRNLLEVDY